VRHDHQTRWLLRDGSWRAIDRRTEASSPRCSARRVSLARRSPDAVRAAARHPFIRDRSLLDAMEVLGASPRRRGNVYSPTGAPLHLQLAWETENDIRVPSSTRSDRRAPGRVFGAEGDKLLHD